MKLKAFSKHVGNVRKRREGGWTFGEVLIVVGVVAALALGGFFIYTQLGGSTEMSQVAGQIGERAGSQNRMISSGLRSSQVSINEYSASVGTMISEHKFITGGDGLNLPSPVTVTAAGTTVCTGGTANSFGFIIRLSETGDSSPDQQQLLEFQGLIVAAIKSAVVDAAGLRRTFNDTGPSGVAAVGTWDLTDLDKSAPPDATATPKTLPVCINDSV